MLEEYIERLKDGSDLGQSESRTALAGILSDECRDDEIARFLTALHEKGETAREIAGFAEVMRLHSVRVETRFDRLVDTAGTGGGIDTFNVSTTAAFVIAGAGLAVAKHGNRAVTSKSGSADMLAALGVRVDAPVQVAVQCLNRIGLAFLFAPLFHPAMKRVAGIRSRLGHRTIFNILGPLTNPAGAPFQVIGVYAPELTETMANALRLLSCGRAWVVHGRDGMDEISHQAPTRVSEVRDGHVHSFEFDPREAGFEPSPGTLQPPGGPEENARICRGLLERAIAGPSRDLTLLNAAAALHVSGVESFGEALEAARRSLDSGAAREKLRLLIQNSAI